MTSSGDWYARPGGPERDGSTVLRALRVAFALFLAGGLVLLIVSSFRDANSPWWLWLLLPLVVVGYFVALGVYGVVHSEASTVMSEYRRGGKEESNE